MDYEKKAISDMKVKRRLEEEEEEAARAGPEYEMGATDVPGPVDPQDQWEGNSSGGGKEEAARAGPEYEMGATDAPGPVDPLDQW